MFKGKKIWIWSVAALIILFSIFILIQKNSSGSWVKLKEGKITDAIYGLATLESEETFRFRPGLTSQVKKLYVKEGDSVHKGSLLLALGEGPAIHSPIDGVVAQLDTKENETVFPSSTLITVVNLDKLELSITLEQASAIRVKVDQKVRIQFESLKGTPIEGHVRSIYPKDGQFFIRVAFSAKLPTLLPGMTADTAILIGEKDHALLMPARAVQRGYITIRQNGSRKKIRPQFGFQDSENIEVLPDPNLGIQSDSEVWVGKL